MMRAAAAACAALAILRSPASGNLASRYPGDVGIAGDASVVWHEDFEEGSVAAVVARYDSSKKDGLHLDTDVPPGSNGSTSMRMTSGGSGPKGTDLFKSFANGTDEVYARYYVKYEKGGDFHHASLQMGGYNPPTKMPQGLCCTQPNGHDHFVVSFEPIQSASDDKMHPRMDFYNYWHTMHSFANNPQPNQFDGNKLINKNHVQSTGNWTCIELHIKLNTGAGSAAGAELGVWVDGALVAQFTDTSPRGKWVADKFCTADADAKGCKDYYPHAPGAPGPLDLQFRTSLDLKWNNFWPQNFITGNVSNSMWYDDMVVATSRVGCMSPGRSAP